MRAKNLKHVARITLLAISLVFLVILAPLVAPVAHAADTNILGFASGGHALDFRADEFFLSNATFAPVQNPYLAPTTTSFTRQNPGLSPTSADILVFRATFTEAVQNVDTADFAVNGTTTATVTLVTSVSASVYDITVSGGDLATFNGTVGLNLSGTQNITNLSGDALPNTEPAIDQTFDVQNNLCTMNENATNEYTIAYKLSIPVDVDYNGASPSYSINNTANIPNGAFDRIGYCLELNTDWVWTSMDAFTTNAALTGVPVGTTIFQQTVNNLDVNSNKIGVVNGTSISTGNIEFWSSCYTTANGISIPGASGSVFDFGDTRSAGSSCYGSMQVHNYGAAQTIFAWNQWDETSPVRNTDLGIGNSSSGNPDWTFRANAGTYSTRTLTVYVRPICQATIDGNWNTVATWNCGRVPRTGDNVRIIGRTVTLDVNTADLGNVTIGSGGTLQNDGNARTLSLTGNWSNSGTFTPGTFIGVTFDGSGTQNLTATSATTFHNLTVNSGVILHETVSADNATVTGTLTNNGTIRKAQAVSSTGAKTFGLAGAFNDANLSIEVTTQDTLSNLQVDRIDSNHPNAATPQQTGRHWRITATGSGFTTNLTLPRNNSGAPSVCRYSGSGTLWSCVNSSQTSNSVTRNGITTYSDWAVGDNAPTAATLTNFSAKAKTGKTGKQLVKVKWKTGSELNVVGFNVWRQVGRAKWKQWNAEMISANQVGQALGDKYRVTDKKVQAGKTYRYKIEIMLANGTSEWSDVIKTKTP